MKSGNPKRNRGKIEFLHEIVVEHILWINNTQFRLRIVTVTKERFLSFLQKEGYFDYI